MSFYARNTATNISSQAYTRYILLYLSKKNLTTPHKQTSGKIAVVQNYHDRNAENDRIKME